jgi:hypothetical protein
MAAVYIGGFSLKIEGGSGLSQTLGILTTFVLYLAVWFVGRMALRGLVGTIPAVIFAVLIATLLLPILAKVGFRVLGVRIIKVAPAHH